MKLNCTFVYVIEPQEHEMLDFAFVPKLLGVFSGIIAGNQFY